MTHNLGKWEDLSKEVVIITHLLRYLLFNGSYDDIGCAFKLSCLKLLLVKI